MFVSEYLELYNMVLASYNDNHKKNGSPKLWLVG